MIARRTPLVARTPLHRGKPLERKSPLLARKPLVSKSAPGRHRAGSETPRDTGPDRLTRIAVLERDQFQCCACGKPVGLPGTWWSIQHRVARGLGGTNELPNLVTLCGSATSPGCHRLAEDRGREMHEHGYWLRSDEDPAQVPIMLASEFGSGITVWLTRDGGYSVEAPEAVA